MLTNKEKIHIIITVKEEESDLYPPDQQIAIGKKPKKYNVIY